MARPPYLGLVGCGKLQGVTQKGGCQNGSTRSSRCQKKRLFSKMILDHMECQNNIFWRVLSSWWPVLATPKSQNTLKTGCFGTKNPCKMDEKCITFGSFGVHKQVEWAHFEPTLSYFGASQGRKGVEK